MKKFILLFLLLATACQKVPEEAEEEEKEMECNPQGRYLVITTFAGTSNRLRTLASAKIMAALTDRELVIDWPILDKEMPARWKDLFRNPLTTYEYSSLWQEGCSIEKIKAAAPGDPVIKNLGVQNDTDGYYRMGKVTEDSEPIVYFGTSLNFKPDTKYISDKEYKKRYRLFYQNLDPSNWVRAEVEKFQADHQFDKKYPIGVHYRAWNMGLADNYVVTDPENKYLEEFVSEMKKAKIAYPNVIFFLATDDPKVKEKLLKVDDLKRTIVTRDVTIERDTVLGQQSALVDWFLLGSTNYIIGTYQSSFSDEAAHLTVQDRKIEIGKSPFTKKP